MLTTRTVARTFQARKCVNRLPPFGAGGALFDGVGANSVWRFASCFAQVRRLLLNKMKYRRHAIG